MSGNLLEKLDRMSDDEDFIKDNKNGIAIITLMQEGFIKNLLNIDDNDKDNKTISMLKEIIPQISSNNDIENSIRNYIFNNMDKIDYLSERLNILLKIDIISREDLEEIFKELRESLRETIAPEKESEVKIKE